MRHHDLGLRDGVFAGSPQDAPGDARGASADFDYRLDSPLLVMNGTIGEEPPMGAHYFTFDGTRLSRLKTIPKPEKRWDAPGAEKPR